MLAEGLVIGLHVVSLHSSPGLNNTNPGVYVKTQAGYTAGTYFNSERRQSFYLGRTFNVIGPVDITAGIITGYKAHPVMPMLVPSVKMDLTGPYAVRLAYVPKVQKGGAHALHLMIERGF